MSAGDFESGRAVPLLIPEMMWRRWSTHGVDRDELIELQETYSGAVGYEFEWGQIIEELYDPDPEIDSADWNDPASPAASWSFILHDVPSGILDTDGQLADLAITLLEGLEILRMGLPEDAAEVALPACLRFDEGHDAISAFAVWVIGRPNVPKAREWIACCFIPTLLPMLIARFRSESPSAVAERAARPFQQ
jgi:hypothetical protein